MPRLSVTLCTHNPDPIIFARTLAALRAQSLPRESWELLIIDNASDHPLASRIDLSWHPHARISREDTLGIAHARKHALHISKAELLVLVDDDNLLAPDYLSTTLALATARHDLGAWGGSIEGEFPRPPDAWLRPYLYALAIRPINKEHFSRQRLPSSAMPVGAGMTIRRNVYESYLKTCARDTRRLALGRVGTALSSGEDIDMALTAIDMGMGVGIFPSLRMTHVIPAHRMEASYIARLMEGIEISHHLLLHLRNSTYHPPASPFFEDLILRWRLRHMAPERRLIERAIARGRRQARRQIARSV